MSLYRTKTELATAILQSKNKIAPDESLSSADQTFLEAAYDVKLSELEDENLAYWEPSNIPLEVFNAMRDLVWNEVRDAYGAPQSDSDRHATEEYLKRKLRRHMSLKSSGHTLKAEYF